MQTRRRGKLTRGYTTRGYTTRGYTTRGYTTRRYLAQGYASSDDLWGERALFASRLRYALFVLFVSLFYTVSVFSGAAAWERLDASTQLATQLERARRGTWQRVLLLAVGPPRVGIQIGHDGVHDHPDELGALRFNTGGYAQGVSELDINRAVAASLKGELGARGVEVDILGATPPPGYHADLLLSLHADSVLDPARRGYKSAHFEPPRSPLEPRLKAAIDRAYLGRVALPDDHENTTGNMRYYYAFNHRRYRHSVHPATPALLVELGYISSPLDLPVLLEPDLLAAALSEGAVAFLRERGRLP